MNFSTLTVSYKRALPLLDTDFLGMSIMISETKFYAISEGIRVNVAVGTPSWKTFATFQPIVLSSDVDESCYSVYTEAYTSYALSKSVAVSALTAYNYFSNPSYSSIAFTIGSIGSTTNLLAKMQSIASWCPIYPSPYVINTVTQVQTTYYYTVGSSASFSITPYSSSYLCGSIPPVFTYTGFYNSNGVQLVPTDFIQVAPSNGMISVTTAGTLTTS